MEAWYRTCWSLTLCSLGHLVRSKHNRRLKSELFSLSLSPFSVEQYKTTRKLSAIRLFQATNNVIVNVHLKSTVRLHAANHRLVISNGGRGERCEHSWLLAANHMLVVGNGGWGERCGEGDSKIYQKQGKEWKDLAFGCWYYSISSSSFSRMRRILWNLTLTLTFLGPLAMWYSYLEYGTHVLLSESSYKLMIIIKLSIIRLKLHSLGNFARWWYWDSDIERDTRVTFSGSSMKLMATTRSKRLTLHFLDRLVRWQRH